MTPRGTSALPSAFLDSTVVARLTALEKQLAIIDTHEFDRDQMRRIQAARKHLEATKAIAVEAAGRDT